MISFTLQSPHSLGFFLRLIFSALVDADFLATEAFMNPLQKDRRNRRHPSIADLETTLTTHLNSLTTSANPTPVNQTRAEVLQHCLAAAGQKPGLFSLTVPTGGGKTLSSLAFALKHARLHDLRRVETTRLPGQTDNATLASSLAEQRQVLAIVNTRRHARELFEILPDDGSRFHLSALMCPAHRRVVLHLIKRRLRQQLPVRLVSTQIVGAGVDIDFPVVFRSLAGLDSIAQAAGRCDREGRLTASLGHPGGQLFLFETSEYHLPSFIRSATNSTVQTLAANPPDPLSLDSIENYFQRHYWDHQGATDQNHILENLPRRLHDPGDLLNFRFKTTARDFQLIDDYTDPDIEPPPPDMIL